MIKNVFLIAALLALPALVGGPVGHALGATALAAEGTPSPAVKKVRKSDEEWKKTLTPEQYEVMRQKGTERPKSGKYWKHKGHGTYVCAACGHPLFSSTTKYNSKTGWPSFWAPINEEAVTSARDHTGAMEVLCASCDAHLGHVFPDGPKPTGQRYCMNSVALDFKKAVWKKK